MKFKTFFIFSVLAVIMGIQELKAQSTVYFFVDFRFWNSEYVFSVNGQEAFKLVPEGKPVSKYASTIMYNMVARKVTFTKEGSYVIAVDCPSAQGKYHANLNLNLEDGETYYVLINANLKRTFYMECVSDKEGQKLLKKAQKSDKYTFNEDFIYNEN